MQTIEEILDANRFHLVDEDCIPVVRGFILENPSLADRDILFISELSIVARHILDFNAGFLDDCLENLYGYQGEGLELIGKSTENYSREKVSFHITAGNLSRRLYKASKDTRWAERWYEGNHEAALLTKDFNPRKAAQTFSFAGEAAKAVFNNKEGMDVEEKILWAERWYSVNSQGAELIAEYDERKSAFLDCYAGNAAREATELIEDPSQKKDWAVKAVTCYAAFRRYFEIYPDPSYSSLFGVTKDRENTLREDFDLGPM